jgi:hypothetical protein
MLCNARTICRDESRSCGRRGGTTGSGGSNEAGRPKGGDVKQSGLLLTAALALVACAGPARAQSVPPVEIAQLPYMEIFSPTFFWSDEADTIRAGSTTCPKGRAITGGINITQGQASLRIVESYPDGESWVIRAVNRKKPESVKSLQVRGYSLCMLPAARKASVLLDQFTKLNYVSERFTVPTGYVSTAGRQACPQGALVISGGFGLDPDFRGPNNLRMELSYPDPNGWNVRSVNGAPGSGPAAEARAHAVCLGNKDGVDIRGYKNIYFAEADVTVKADQGVVRQSVGCKEQGAYVLAGGMRAARGRSASLEMQESFPDSPSSWTLAVTIRGDKKAGDVTARLYAVCIKK